MTVQEIAESISVEDRHLVLTSKKAIRRSRIEVIQDEHDKIDTEIDEQVAEDIQSDIKRKSVEREWPTVNSTGVVATNPWTGEQHNIDIMENKKRKHGIDFVTQDGYHFHSPSPLAQHLFKRRVSNGWDCLSWESGDGDND
jgi:hypothetical protein